MYSSKSILFFITSISCTPFTYANTSYVDSDFSSPVAGITSNSSSGDVNITTSAASNPQIINNSGYGLHVLDGTTLTVDNVNEFKIDANWGIRVANNAGSSSTLLLNGLGDIVINSAQRGIFVTNTSSLVSDSNISITSGMAGIWAYDAGSMTFNKEVDITATNYGVIAQKMDPNAVDPNIAFNDKVSINILGTGMAVVGQADSNVGAEGGKIEFNNGLIATTANGNVIESTEKTHIIINGESKLTSQNGSSMAAIASDGQIDINGKSTIIGHVAGIDNGVVNLNLTQGSEITGAMTKNSGSGQVNLD